MNCYYCGTELIHKGDNRLDNDEEYKYLLKMSMDSVSEENVEKLTKEFNEKMEELNLIKSTSIEHMWLHELQTLEQMYVKSQK